MPFWSQGRGGSYIEPVDDFDEYDPTPYGCGYDLHLTFGRPIPPSDKLAAVELPSTVEVMKERVEFLHKLDLTVDDINSYPLMLGCSLRKNIIPVLAYLQQIGFPKSKLGEFIKNFPQVLHASIIVELAPVVRFLRSLDVEKQDIPYVLSRFPELLEFKLE